MADTNANINFNVNATQALAAIKSLQSQLSRFYTDMSRSSAAAQASAANMQQNLVNGINATGKFSAQMTTVRTTTESFTNALEKNKLSLGQYYRYAGASTKSFGRKFTSEFATIDKVARERVKDLQTQYVKLGRDANGAMKAIAVRPATLDLQNFGTQTAIAAQKQALFNQLIKQGSTNLLNWGKNTQWAGRQLMVGFTIPLTIMGTVASREFMKLEEQAIKFKRVYGDLFTTSAETGKALADMKTLGEEFTKYGIAVEATLGLAAQVAQMGNTGKELEAQVREATRLSVLGGMEQQEALDTTISVTNAFGVSTEDLTQKINFLNAAENQTILSIQDFNEAVPKAGSVVKQLGGDVEDLAFFLTAMREGGVNASQSANALKSSLARLINPTQVATDRLGELGINIKDIVNKNAGDLRGTVMELAYALDTLDPLEKSRAIEQLFGKFQFARMSALFQNITTEGSQANEVLSLMNMSAKELQQLASRELGRVEESAVTKFRKAVEEFQAQMAPIGEQFLKAVTPIIEFGTTLLKRFNEISDGGKQFVTILIGVIGGIAPVLIMTIGLMANLIASTIKGIATVMGFFQRFRNGSQVLAEQTNYLNSEQLESASIAASLDQVHQKLIQTYTGEAGSLDVLRQAYERAASSQRGFMGPIATSGGMMRAKGYNNGVVSVPGSGNGDTVPAMLTPGEAVIPKEMAKKYAPLINAMISNNIPGYKNGLFAEAFGSRGSNAMESSHISGFTPRELRSTIQMIVETLGEGAADLKFEVIEMGGEIDAASGKLKTSIMTLADIAALPDDRELMTSGQTYRGTAVGESRGRNQMYSSIDMPGAPKTLDELAAAEEKILQARREQGSQLDRHNEELEKLSAESRRAQKLLADNNNATKNRIDYMRKLAAQAITESAMTDKSVSAEQRQTIATRRIAEVEEKMAALIASGMDEAQLVQHAQAIYAQAMLESSAIAGRGDAMQLAILPPGQGSRPAGRNIASGRSVQSPFYRGGSQRDISSEFAEAAIASGVPQEEAIRNRSESSAFRVLDAVVEGAEDGLEISSPSERMRRVGDEAAEGFVIGFQQGLSDTTQSGRESAATYKDPSGKRRASSRPFTPGQESVAETQSGRAKPRRASFDPANNTVTTRDAKGNILAQQQLRAATTNTANSMNATSVVSNKLTAGLGNFGKNLQSMSGKITGGAFALSGLVGAASMSGGALGDFASKMFPLVSVITALTMAMQMLNVATIQASITTRRAAAARAIVEASQAGKIAARGGGLVGMLGRVGVGLAGFLGPVSLVVGGLALLAGGIFALYKIAENQKSKIEGLGNAAQVTAGRLEAINAATGEQGTANAFDVESAASASAETGEAASISKDQMIEGMRESEDFLEEYKDTINGIGSTTAENAVSTLENLFTSLLLSGYSEDAASAVVDAITLEAERTDLSLNLKPIDLEDKGSLSGIRENFAAGAQGVGANAGQLVTTSGAGGYRQTQVQTQAEQETTAASTTAIATSIKSLKAMRDAGTITANELQTEFEAMGESLKESVDPANVPAFVEGLAPQLGLEEVLEDVDNMDYALAIVNLKLQGLEIPQSTLDAFKAASEPGADPEDVANANALADSINNTAAAQATANEQTEAAAALEEQRKASTLAAEEALDARLTTAQEEVDVYNALVDAGVEAADAQDMIGDATLRAALAAEIGTDAFDGLIDQYYEVKALEGEASKLKGGGSGGSGGGPKASPLDDITKKLRLVTDSQVRVTKGFAASLDELNKFGSAGTEIFGGMNQQLRSLGAGEDLISLIAGMDPEEFERRKGDLFTFDGAGNISGFTSQLENIQKAMRAIAMGEFQNTQKQTVSNINNQVTAVRKLTAAGMSQADAYEAVKDTAMAAAIAQEQNVDVIRELAQATQQATDATEAFAAAQAVSRKNQDVKDLKNSLNYIQKNQASLSDAQRQAILSDPNLQALIGTDIDPGALKEALRNAEAQADLDLRIKKLTFEGRLQIFEDGFSKAMESFAVKERTIQLDFDVKKEPFLEAIKKAEEEISDIRNSAGGLDDMEADLERISAQEDLINESYDLRLDALKKMEESNERINNLKKSQLSIADALSQGDIAAAAAAVQEARAEQSKQAIADRKDLLEISKQRELGRVTGNMGKTREEIEQAVKDIKQQILEIEESTIEPAQRRVELLDREQEKLVDGLDVLGKTKKEWERIKNGIDIAKISSDKYIKSIQEALDIVDNITDYWDDLDGRVIKTTHEIKEVTVRSFSNGGNNGGGNNDDDDDDTPDTSMTSGTVLAAIQQGERLMARQLVGGMYGAGVMFASGGPVPAKYAMGGPVRKYAMGGLASRNGPPLQMSVGGKVPGFAAGGMSMGSDTIPAMLTPGEFVIRRPAVQGFGIDNLEKINSGTSELGSVYNYNLSVNVKSDSNPNDIARTVMSQIKRVDSQRIRGNKL